MRVKNISVILFVLGIFVISCYGEDLVFIDKNANSSSLMAQIKRACDFYGLSMKSLLLETKPDAMQIIGHIRRSKAEAVIINAEALFPVNSQEFYSILEKENKKDLSLLIAGLSPKMDTGLLEEWSDGVITGCEKGEMIPAEYSYRFGDVQNMTRELSGQQIPLTEKEICYFTIQNLRKYQSILGIKRKNTKGVFPLYVSVPVSGHEVFFMIRGNSPEQSQKSKEMVPEVSMGTIRYLMFLRYVYKDQCWHSPAHFANFTIDDPWLTESYGNLNFAKLCYENEKNFHLTIAFIPWNFDRSEPRVVDLFKNFPERLSLCVHGNNHDHYEFYKYETDSNDPWEAKSLNLQEENIRQAVARMEKHKELTGLDYDKVMIFPHSIAPAKTLGLLKKYNFLATVNANNIPLGAEKPEDPLFDLRSLTLKYENFASFRRHPPYKTEFEIALDLFVDKPLLFYAHHDYFKKGMDSFDKTAQMVNRMEPEINWKSLGYIAKHYYLERLRADGNYDVKAFTNHFKVKNHHQRDVTYFIQKEENFSVPIKQVLVNGEKYSYKRANNHVILELDIPKGGTGEVYIQYENDLNVRSMDISKDDSRINKLRKISDFRDNTLSKNFMGRFVIHVYYDTGLYKWGMKKLILVFSIMILFVGISLGGWIYLRRQKKKFK